MLNKIMKGRVPPWRKDGPSDLRCLVQSLSSGTVLWLQCGGTFKKLFCSLFRKYILIIVV